MSTPTLIASRPWGGVHSAKIPRISDSRVTGLTGCLAAELRIGLATTLVPYHLVDTRITWYWIESRFHDPKVGGSNPPPAGRSRSPRRSRSLERVDVSDTAAKWARCSVFVFTPGGSLRGGSRHASKLASRVTMLPVRSQNRGGHWGSAVRALRAEPHCGAWYPKAPAAAPRCGGRLDGCDARLVQHRDR